MHPLPLQTSVFVPGNRTRTRLLRTACGRWGGAWQTPGAAGRPPETPSLPPVPSPKCHGGGVGGGWRPCAPARLASPPQPVIPTRAAPRPPLPAAGTSNHHAPPRSEHLPDVGREEARCGDADGSAQALVGACSPPREAGVGPCSVQERPAGTRTSTRWTEKSDGTGPSRPANAASLAATSVPPPTPPHPRVSGRRPASVSGYGASVFTVTLVLAEGSGPGGSRAAAYNWQLRG